MEKPTRTGPSTAGDSTLIAAARERASHIDVAEHLVAARDVGRARSEERRAHAAHSLLDYVRCSTGTPPPSHPPQRKEFFRTKLKKKAEIELGSAPGPYRKSS